MPLQEIVFLPALLGSPGARPARGARPAQVAAGDFVLDPDPI